MPSFTLRRQCSIIADRSSAILKLLVNMTYKLWAPQGNKNGYKALIAAKYVGVKLEQPSIEMGKTNKTPEFLKLNPFGKVKHLQVAL